MMSLWSINTILLNGFYSGRCYYLLSMSICFPWKHLADLQTINIIDFLCKPMEVTSLLNFLNVKDNEMQHSSFKIDFTVTHHFIKWVPFPLLYMMFFVAFYHTIMIPWQLTQEIFRPIALRIRWKWNILRWNSVRSEQSTWCLRYSQMKQMWL